MSMHGNPNYSTWSEPNTVKACRDIPNMSSLFTFIDFSETATETCRIIGWGTYINCNWGLSAGK